MSSSEFPLPPSDLLVWLQYRILINFATGCARDHAETLLEITVAREKLTAESCWKKTWPKMKINGVMLVCMLCCLNYTLYNSDNTISFQCNFTPHRDVIDLYNAISLDTWQSTAQCTTVACIQKKFGGVNIKKIRHTWLDQDQDSEVQDQDRSIDKAYVSS